MEESLKGRNSRYDVLINWIIAFISLKRTPGWELGVAISPPLFHSIHPLVIADDFRDICV